MAQSDRWRRFGAGMLIAALMLPANLAHAQVQPIDPNAGIDADLAPQPARPGMPATPATPPSPSVPSATVPTDQSPPPSATTPPSPSSTSVGQDAASAANGPPGTTLQSTPVDATYQEDDLIGAAEGVFGKGAKGLADVIKGILKKQGRPNAYIAGREGGGAFVVGLRYGSGTLFHKIEGKMPVYWTGPSIGFDAGADAGSTFILVYNLYDTADLFHRFVAGEGAAYFVGGFNVSYLRRGDVVLIPVRLGVGLRLGVNAGYMKFSHKQKWLPF